MPGAKLESSTGDVFHGSVRVKLGAMVLTYRGQARIVEQDDAAHRAVIEATAKESRGAGTAKATVTMSLQTAGDATNVTVMSRLFVTGKPAQFGRGVMADVAERLVGQFADHLRDELLGTSVLPGPTESAERAGASMEGASVSAAAEPIDLLAVAGSAVAKRAALTAALLLPVLLLLSRVLRRR
jgi:carbon monoxide dehydrogenase subunit G